jgi:LPS export ABC transporter protein LptC
MVLKRGLYLAIFIALLVIFVQIDNTKIDKKISNNALISFYNATVYDIGDEYVKIQAREILRYKNKDNFKMLRIEFLNAKNETYIIEANNGVLKNELMELSGNVICLISDNGVLNTSKLFYNQKSKLLYNKHKFKLEYDSHILIGKSFSLNSSNNNFNALDTKFILKLNKQSNEHL